MNFSNILSSTRVPQGVDFIHLNTGFDQCRIIVLFCFLIYFQQTYAFRLESMHYWLRPFEGVQFRFDNLGPHLISIQIQDPIQINIQPDKQITSLDWKLNF